MAGSHKVNGLPELLAKLGSLGERDTVEKIAYRGTFGASKDLRERARENARSSTHTRTGALERGFAMKRITDGTRRGYTVGVRHGRRKMRGSSDDPYYWWQLEFGTRYIAPRGFFRRAFAEAQHRAPQQIIAAGRKAVLDSGNRALKRFGSGKAGR